MYCCLEQYIDECCDSDIEDEANPIVCSLMATELIDLHAMSYLDIQMQLRQ